MENNLTPIIPFNMLIDTDVGVIRTLAKYKDSEKLFYKGILEAPLKPLIYTLVNREHINPLIIASKNKDDIDALDEIYDSIITNEYESVIANSITTELVEAVRLFFVSGPISPFILCKSEYEKSILEKIKLDGIPIVMGDYDTIDLDPYDPVYIKNIDDAVPIRKRLTCKNLYIADYGFNYTTLSTTGDKILKPEATILLKGIVKPTLVSTYKMDASYIVVG